MHIASRLTLVAAAIAGLASLAGHAGAAVTVYTDRASYAAATGASGTDHFADLVQDSSGLAGPLTRAAGAIGYQVGAVDTAGLGQGQGGDYLYVLGGSAGSPWLSTNFASSYLAFSGFTAPARSIGGAFFTTDFDGQSSQFGLRFTISDGGGSFSYAVASGSPSGFLGFTSDSAISAFSVASEQGAADRFVTVGELTISAVPEPGSAAMFGLGLGLLALAGGERARKNKA